MAETFEGLAFENKSKSQMPAKSSQLGAPQFLRRSSQGGRGAHQPSQASEDS